MTSTARSVRATASKPRSHRDHRHQGRRCDRCRTPQPAASGIPPAHLGVGLQGRVLQSYLDLAGPHEAAALRDYDASRLTVVDGEIFEIVDEVGVWLLVRNSARLAEVGAGLDPRGRGWRRVMRVRADS